MRQLSLKDLYPADVLLFSPEENSFISQAITFLTNANVSHAALYFHSAPPPPLLKKRRHRFLKVWQKKTNSHHCRKHLIEINIV
ncbi:hypothetical protein ACEZG3_005431 [Escherichia coli]